MSRWSNRAANSPSLNHTSERPLVNPAGLRGTRRKFLGGLGVAGAGAVASTMLSTPRVSLAGHEPTVFFSSDRVRDGEVLNFALNLEYLEAEFYLRAAFGTGLSDADISGSGTLGAVTGGSKVPFVTDTIRQYAEEIAMDEEAHVRLLRAATAPTIRYAGYSGGNKGPGPVARPAINLTDSFTAAARAAGVVGADETFDPFADEVSFLLGAFIFEDVGVTAYRGGAPVIRDPAYLSAAAGILGVEAYHAGEIRTLLFALGQNDPSILDAVAKISDLRDTADGDGDTDQGVVDSDGNANIIPTDPSGLVFARTFQQVLNIVYLGGAAANYGFFPNKLNGVIS